jgi:ABC-2 type transport system ATP-binding protein
MVEFKNISKRFNGKTALADVSLDIAAGEVFGLLGHNGAGKSTACGILVGQIFPDSGEALIRGVSVQRNRKRALQRVGAIYETPGFYDYLSGWDNLEVFTSYSDGVSRRETEEAVELVGLTARIHDPVRMFSHGMRQRLALAQALLPKPDLVLLDEPMNGLDPEGIIAFRALIKTLAQERGITVALSSHLLFEVEQLCDRVAILENGRLVFLGRWTELAGTEKQYRLTVDDWTAAEKIVRGLGCDVTAQNAVVLARSREIADVVAALVHAGVRVHAVEPLRASLEECYLQTIRGG